MAHKLQVKIKPEFIELYPSIDPEQWYDVKQINLMERVRLSDDRIYLRRTFDERTVQETETIPMANINTEISTVDRIVQRVVIEHPQRVEIIAGGKRYVIKIDDMEFEVYSAHPDYDAVIEIAK